MKHPFGGIYPALLTPFTLGNQVNEKALRELVRLNLRKGVSGFYVGGSTSEAFLLTDEERKSLYRIVADEARGKCKLIAHVGAISTDAAIAFAQVAKEEGYDAVSAVAPFYYKFSFDQIKKYYFDIVNAVNMPMIIYNIPAFSGVSLTVEQVGEFFHDDRFIGIKHTSNDYFALEQFKRTFPNKVVFNGYDEMFLSGLAMGADGAIGSTFNFMAEKFIEIQKLFGEKKTEEALKVQGEANRIIKVLCKVGVMEGEKEVLCGLGIDFGHMRAPFSILTDEQKKIVRDEITDTL